MGKLERINSVSGKGMTLSQHYYYSLEQLFSGINTHIGILKMNIDWNCQDKIKQGSKRTIDSIPGNERYCCWGLIYPDEMKELLLGLYHIINIPEIPLIIENKRDFRNIHDVIDFMIFVLNWDGEELN